MSKDASPGSSVLMTDMINMREVKIYDAQEIVTVKENKKKIVLKPSLRKAFKNKVKYEITDKIHDSADDALMTLYLFLANK